MIRMNPPKAYGPLKPIHGSHGAPLPSTTTRPAPRPYRHIQTMIDDLPESQRNTLLASLDHDAHAPQLPPSSPLWPLPDPPHIHEPPTDEPQPFLYQPKPRNSL